MSSRKINNSTSSSEDDENRYAKITDEKKRKRMISNRESARRSRMKKEQHVKDLNDQAAYLRTKSDEMLKKMNEIGPRYMAVESENMILRMQGEELKKRLELLQEVLVSCKSSSYDHVCDDDDVLNINNNNIDHHELINFTDILQEPWLQHGFDQSQAVGGIYQC
ncbi:basic leucine zipper 43 [Phtheirospermum japonicum]|uniref:Basic leucine zipper 43 n=1 Tax=Phtheirospermum japonicum TaxID=374723 RepID=A0A830D4T4_9LAMI|nr:basic leucine zipper 43 [Phtheirospermum japonicum]